MPLIQTEAEREFVEQMLAERRFTTHLPHIMDVQVAGVGDFGIVYRSEDFTQHGVLKVFRNNTSSDDDVRREATVLLLLEFHKVSGVPKLLEWTTNLAGGHKGEKQAILVEDGGSETLDEVSMEMTCDEATCASIFVKVFTTLLQMRNIGFSNNDVSLKNIVTSTAMMSPSSDLMLVDFGSAERADKPGGRIPISRACKQDFLDPHVLLGHMEALYGLETLHMKGEQSGWQRDMYALGVVVAKLQNWTVDPYVGVAQQRGMKGNELFEVISSAMALKLQDRFTPEQYELTTMFKKCRALERERKEEKLRNMVLLGERGAAPFTANSCDAVLPREHQREVLIAGAKEELVDTADDDLDDDDEYLRSGYLERMSQRRYGKDKCLAHKRSQSKAWSAGEATGDDDGEMPTESASADGRPSRAEAKATSRFGSGSGCGSFNGSSDAREVTHAPVAQVWAGVSVAAAMNAPPTPSGGSGRSGSGSGRDECTDVSAVSGVNFSAVKEEMMEAPEPSIRAPTLGASREPEDDLYPFYGDVGATGATARYGTSPNPAAFPSLTGRKTFTTDNPVVANYDRGASLSGESFATMARPIAGTRSTNAATGFTAAASHGQDARSTMLDALSDMASAAGAARPPSSVAVQRPFERRSVPVAQKVTTTAVAAAAAAGTRNPGESPTEAVVTSITTAAATGSLSSVVGQKQSEKRSVSMKEDTSEKAATAATAAAPVAAAAIATATDSGKRTSDVPTAPGEAGAAETVTAQLQDDSRANAERDASSSQEGGGITNRPSAEAPSTVARGVRRSRRIAAMASVKAEIAATAACAARGPSISAAASGEKTRKRCARRGATTGPGSAGGVPPVPTGPAHALKRARADVPSSNGKKRQKLGGGVGGVTNGTSKQTTRKVKEDGMKGEKVDSSKQGRGTRAKEERGSQEAESTVGMKEDATSRKRKAVDGGESCGPSQARKRRRSPSSCE